MTFYRIFFIGLIMLWKIEFLKDSSIPFQKYKIISYPVLLATSI